MNLKKLRRIYREERLQVRRRGGRKRALGTRAPIAIPQAANQRWSLDFAFDALSDGRRFRILVVVDDFTPGCPTDPVIAGRGGGVDELAASTALTVVVKPFSLSLLSK
jgi:hypothetical protein